MYGRVDQDRYRESLQTCLNYIVRQQGCLIRRSGTRYVAPTCQAGLGLPPRAVRFEFSATQAYILEFGQYNSSLPVPVGTLITSGYMRVYRNNAAVLEAAVNITGITNANPAVVSVSGTPFVNGDEVEIYNVTGMTQVNGRRFTVINSGAGSFALKGIDSTNYGAYAGGGTVARVFTIKTPYVQADLFQLKFAQSADTLYIAHPSYAPYKVQRTGDAAWTITPVANALGPFLPINTTTTTLTLSGSSGSVTVTASSTTGINGGTGFTASDVGRLIQWTSNNLALTWLRITAITDTTHVTATVEGPNAASIFPTTSWYLGSNLVVDGPYFPINPTLTTLTLSGTTNTVTVTASSTHGINGDQGFLAGDQYRLIRFKDPMGNWTNLQIMVVTDSTHVTAIILGPAASAGTATVNWRLGTWSTNTGWPAAVCFFEDRLWLCGATSTPQRLDSSNSGDYENFSPSNPAGTAGDSNAIGFTLNAQDVNVIRWVRAAQKALIIGTIGDIWIARKNIIMEAMTPTNVAGRPAAKFGVADIDPIQVGNGTFFVQRSKRKMREITYEASFYTDTFSANDMTLDSEHLPRQGIVQLAYQLEPISVIWAARADGALLGMTYERTGDSVMSAWHRHQLGGFSDANGTPAAVESVAAIPSADGTRDELWMVVRRYIGGQVVRYFEYMTKIFEDIDTQANAFFVDAGASYNGAKVSVIGGLWHLNGETVSILADGAVQPDAVVTNGTITLADIPAVIVNVGYKYNSDGQTLRTDIGAGDGTAMGKTRRQHRVGFQFYRTLGFTFGPNFSQLDEMNFRDSSMPTDAAVSLFTGIRSEPWDADYNFDNFICWRQYQPLPGTILGVYPMQHTFDR